MLQHGAGRSGINEKKGLIIDSLFFSTMDIFPFERKEEVYHRI